MNRDNARLALMRFANMFEELPGSQVIDIKGQRNYREYNWLNHIRDSYTTAAYAFIRFSQKGREYSYGWSNPFTDFDMSDLIRMNAPEGGGLHFRSEPFENPSDCREKSNYVTFRYNGKELQIPGTRLPSPASSKHPEGDFLREYRIIDKIQRWALGKFYAKLPSKLHKYGTLPEVLHIYLLDNCKPSSKDLYGPGAGEPIKIPRKEKLCGDLESHAIEWLWRYGENTGSLTYLHKFLEYRVRDFISRAAKKNQRLQQGLSYEDWTESAVVMQSGKTPAHFGSGDTIPGTYNAFDESGLGSYMAATGSTRAERDLHKEQQKMEREEYNKLKTGSEKCV